MLLLCDEPQTDTDDYLNPATEPLDPGPQLTLPDTDLTSPNPSEHFHLSQAAFLGPPSPKTLRVQGKIHELTVTILIDLGSSHNIMQSWVVEFLKLPIVVINPFSVIVGNGASIQCSGSCASSHCQPDVPYTIFHSSNSWGRPCVGCTVAADPRCLSLGPKYSFYPIYLSKHPNSTHWLTLQHTHTYHISSVQ